MNSFITVKVEETQLQQLEHRKETNKHKSTEATVEQDNKKQAKNEVDMFVTLTTIEQNEDKHKINGTCVK